VTCAVTREGCALTQEMNASERSRSSLASSFRATPGGDLRKMSEKTIVSFVDKMHTSTASMNAELAAQAHITN